MIKEIAVIILVGILTYLIYELCECVSNVWSGYRENKRRKINTIKLRESNQVVKDLYRSRDGPGLGRAFCDILNFD